MSIKNELVFIGVGDKYYYASGTMMGSLYTQGKHGLRRSDWGFVMTAVENGNTVKIRPPTKSETKQLDAELEEFERNI